MAEINETETTKKKRGWAIFGIGCGCLFLIVLLVVGLLLYTGWLGYKESPKMVEVQDYTAQLEDPYTLSANQQEQLFSGGYPDAFTILFYEEETISGGNETVRLETWDYYEAGVGFTFINGELTAEDPLEGDIPGSLEPLPYYPEQFEAFMSLDEVVAAAEIDSYVEIPLEAAYLEGGILYYAYSLTFGFVNDELRFIEALALSD